MAETSKRRRRPRESGPRVTNTESSSRRTGKSARHRQVTKPKVEGTITPVGEGKLEIAAQLSELVPVAQYANVTIGPVQLQWTLGGVDMEIFTGVDWDKIEDDESLEEELTDAQLAMWRRIRGGMRSTMKLIEFTIAEDRDLVYDSVAAHNEREQAKSK